SRSPWRARAGRRSHAAIPPSTSGGAWRATAPTRSRRAARSSSRSRSIAPSSPPSPPTCASPTTSPSSSLTGTAAVLVLLGFAAPAPAGAGQAGRFSVVGVGGGRAVVARPFAFFGGELGIARRLGSGLTRLAFGAAGGAYEGRAGMRLAATAQ